MPEHAEIVAAVALTGDAELASWVEKPGSYIVDPVAVPVLQHNEVFRVAPISVSIPLSFFVVRGPDGELRVSSGQVGTVAQVLATEPQLGPASVPELVFQLLREQSRPWKLLSGATDTRAPAALVSLVSAPQASLQSGAWDVQMDVLMNSRTVEHWSFVLGNGATTWKRVTLGATP